LIHFQGPQIAIVESFAVAQMTEMNKTLVFIIGLSFVGLLGFTVNRNRVQAQAITALNLKIAGLEKTTLQRASDHDDLADSITDLKAKIIELDTNQDAAINDIKNLRKSVSTIDTFTIGLDLGDAEKRLKTLEIWRLLVVDPTIDVVKASDPVISSINYRLSKVEEKLKKDSP
jgi:cell division protein FtsB